MVLQVRQEAGGFGDYGGDWGGALRAGESGNPGSDGGFLSKSLSGDVGKEGRVSTVLPFLLKKNGFRDDMKYGCVGTGSSLLCPLPPGAGN